MAERSLQKEEIRIIEALLFSSPEPLTQSKVDVCFDSDSAPSLEEVILQLQREYDRRHNAIQIERVAGGYRLVTRPEYDPWIERLHSRTGKTSLSRAALEAVAIIAYRGPVTRTEIENIRGVNSGSVLKTLLEKNLVTIKGRGGGPGRPLLYAVTGGFLVSFGLNKLSDLPKLREMSELTQEPSPTNRFVHNRSGKNAPE